MSQDLNDYVNGKVQKAVSDTMKAMSKREEPFMNFIRGSDEIDTSAIFDAVAIDFEGQRQAALKALSKTEAGQKCLAELARLDQAQHQAGMDAVAVAVRQQKDPMGLLQKIDDHKDYFKNLFIEEKPKFNPILKEPILPLIPLTKEPKF